MNEVKEAVWNGKLPLEIHLDDPQLQLNFNSHVPLFLLESRLTYLPLLIPQIGRHFGGLNAATTASTANSAVISSEFDDFEEERLSHSSHSRSRTSSTSSLPSAKLTFTEGCFSALFGEERILLPWHLPLGLLFDLCCVGNGPLLGPETLKILPFKLTFHTSGTTTPSTHISLPLLQLSAQIPLEEAMTSVYFAALKESDYVRCGSSKNVMNLSRTEQMQLWESLRTGQFERFWRTNVKLTSSFTAKAVPLKIWLFDGKQMERYQLSVPVNEQTVQEWLQSELSITKYTALCHGIILPLDCKLSELFSNFLYADNFIHLIVIKE